MRSFHYNGQVFTVTDADVPERGTEYVSGAYELDSPLTATTVGVKIADMLGEEVLVTQLLS